VFDAVRPGLAAGRTLEGLNAAAEARGLRTESGRPVRFVAPFAGSRGYEIEAHETGRVATRAENLHDWFNALAWLAFPLTKARMNAIHAEEIPREREALGGKRGRRRDLLTIFDEGGAIVAGSAAAQSAIREARWRELFLERHDEFRIVVLGHAVLEQALAPRPSITCKVVFADPAGALDAQAAAAIASFASPKDLPPLPVFGYPGWLPESAQPGFYDDTRYFRPASAPPKA
jgi:hypothetical protein